MTIFLVSIINLLFLFFFWNLYLVHVQLCSSSSSLSSVSSREAAASIEWTVFECGAGFPLDLLWTVLQNEVPDFCKNPY